MPTRIPPLSTATFGRGWAVAAAAALLAAALAAADSTVASPEDGSGTRANPANLGAAYDDAAEAVEFKVHSSRATRIDVYLYEKASGSQEKASVPLKKDADSDVWSAEVPADKLKKQYGIAGPVYYGYRAWGPNWPYDSDWKKGSSAGFKTRRRRGGQPLQPQQAPARPVRP